MVVFYYLIAIISTIISYFIQSFDDHVIDLLA